MATTEKNILNNWFRTGAKPTQEQFWNWQDSYWHKNEDIPQSQIQDLDTTLANKADSSALDVKANADSSGLTAKNIISWKKALGVGELPSNIATVDEGGKQGNAYTKTEIDNQLRNKLNKPDIYDMTFTDDRAIEDGFMVIASDDLEDAFAVRTSDFLRLSGNMANSRLTTTTGGSITQGANYVWDTAGYYFSLKNLPNKSADPTFNLLLAQNSDGQTAVSNGKAVLENLMASLPSVKNEHTGNYNLAYNEYLVYDPITGKFAKSDRPQIVSNYNVPSTITINHNLSNSAINLVYNGGEPNIPDNIRQAMERVKQMEQLPYTFFKPSDLVISTMPKSEYPASIRDSYTIPNDVWEMPQNGILKVKKPLPIPPEFEEDKYYFDNRYYTLTNAQFNVELPSNKDWIIRIQSIYPFYNIANAMSFEPNIGNHRSSIDDMIAILHNTITRFHPPGMKNGYGLSNWINSELFFIKTGDIITIFIRNMFSGSIETAIIPYKDRYKYLTFKMANNGLGKSVFPNWLAAGNKLVNMGYWIQP